MVMVTPHQMTIEIGRCIEDFRANVMEPRMAENLSIVTPSIDNLRSQMAQVDMTLQQVKDQFGIEKADLAQRFDVAEQNFQDKFNTAERQFIQYQSQPQEDMQKHNVLFKRVDDL